ncbi:MAG: CHAT domain-containing protein [Deltaproteobacteria bacterium]|nr:CHAT domain-containing protein [Deltaproteobacteria bacterium]
MRSRWLPLALALLPLGCDRSTDEVAPAPSAAPASVAPAWAGCDDWVEDACMLLERGAAARLRLWVDVPPSTVLTVRVDGNATVPSTTLADGGTLARIEVPAGAREVSVTGAGVEGTLAIEWQPSDAAVAGALASLAEGRVDEGCRGLRQLAPSVGVFQRVQARIQEVFTCDAALGPEHAVGRLREAAELAAQAGLDKLFVHVATALLFTCVERTGDRACATQWSARLDHAWRPELDLRARYSRGLWAMKRGELSTAVQLFESSARWAERFGMTADYDAASEQRSALLAELGRVEATRAASQRLYASARERSDACARAQGINNAAWPLQTLVETSLIDDPPIEWWLEELDLYERGDCDDPRSRLLARINLASALLEGGDLEGAIAWLERIRSDDLPAASTGLLPEIDYLALNLAMASNRWELAPVPLLLEREGAGEARLRWRTAVQRALLLERFELDAAALDAWRRAEAILDAEVSSLGLAQGRETLISARFTSARGLVDALLRSGRVDEALCRIRLARGRALRAADRRAGGERPSELAQSDAFAQIRSELDLEAAADWEYSADEQRRRRARRDERRREALNLLEQAGAPGSHTYDDCSLLRPRAPDELLLALLPARDETLAIVHGPAGARAWHATEIPEHEADAMTWGAALVDGLGDDLADVERLRVLPVGAAWTVPLHAARTHGAPLVDRVAVAYGLDLPRRSVAAPSARAMVVADPSEDLPQARAEQQLVVEALRAAAWQVQLLQGSAAGRTEVLAGMGEVELFHYAGHGAHRGDDGWDGALLLDRGSTIEAADVLALPRVPRFVVLAGCETGAVRSALVDGGMSLGRAFLLAGADAVLVGDRKLGDEDSAAFARALYDGSAAPGAFDATAAVRRAYQRRQASDAAPDAWAGFRLLVR